MGKVYYRQPKYTTEVTGRHDVGFTGDGQYATECCRDREFGDSFAVGYALADTIEEARTLALQRLVAAENRGEKW